MKRVCIITLLWVVLASCSGKKADENVPQKLLTEPEMVAIMADIQLMESDLNLRKTNGQDIKDRTVEYYGQLFEHHGITDSVFMENLRYYTRQPAVLERIMDSVVVRLTAEQTESRRDNSQ